MARLNELAGSRRISGAKHGAPHDVFANAVCEGPSAACVRVLVVEDEAACGRCLLRTIKGFGGAATLVDTVHDAHEQRASGASWSALIVDVLLPDGSGLDILREARARGIGVPALVISGLHDNDVAYAAFELGTPYLVKPVDGVYVESLVHHASQRGVGVHTGSRVQGVMADWTARFRLSEAERSILLLAAEGHDRAAIATIRGSSEATVKNQISNLFQKTGDLCLREAVVRLLRESAS
jgi:DNA-binding NarL/FixJ family response regulator